MIAVVDYGMGNLHSMAKAIEYVGEDVRVTSEADVIRAADRIVLPGVGAFGECMANLARTGLLEVLREQVLERRRPFLGVCVGMQLLADVGHEHGEHAGLGWVPGEVVRLQPDDPASRVPHTGWNDLEVAAGDGAPVDALRGTGSFYFNHSYRFAPAEPGVVAATCTHGETFAAVIHRDNVLATQFHPEKSQQGGLDFLADFADWDPGG